MYTVCNCMQQNESRKSIVALVSPVGCTDCELGRSRCDTSGLEKMAVTKFVHSFGTNSLGTRIIYAPSAFKITSSQHFQRHLGCLLNWVQQLARRENHVACGTMKSQFQKADQISVTSFPTIYYDLYWFVMIYPFPIPSILGDIKQSLTSGSLNQCRILLRTSAQVFRPQKFPETQVRKLCILPFSPLQMRKSHDFSNNLSWFMQL